jgi:hypothetical protein
VPVHEGVGMDAVCCACLLAQSVGHPLHLMLSCSIDWSHDGLGGLGHDTSDLETDELRGQSAMDWE